MEGLLKDLIEDAYDMLESGASDVSDPSDPSDASADSSQDTEQAVSGTTTPSTPAPKSFMESMCKLVVEGLDQSKDGEGGLDLKAVCDALGLGAQSHATEAAANKDDHNAAPLKDAYGGETSSHIDREIPAKNNMVSKLVRLCEVVLPSTDPVTPQQSAGNEEHGAAQKPAPYTGTYTDMANLERMFAAYPKTKKDEAKTTETAASETTQEPQPTSPVAEQGMSLKDAYGIDTTQRIFEPKDTSIKTEHFEFSGKADAPAYILKHVGTVLKQMDMIAEKALEEGDREISTTKHFQCKGLRCISPAYSTVIKTIITSLEDLVVASSAKKDPVPWMQNAQLFQS